MKPEVHFLLFLLLVSFSVQVFGQNVSIEGQHIPDQGNGYYQNPILAGDSGIRLFSWGKGRVILSDFRYVGLE
jgi:hypothetical protein